MSYIIEKNDLGLLSIIDSENKPLIISATKQGYQIGLTPKQAHLIAAAPKMAELLERLVNNGWNASISEEAKEILNTIH